MRRLVQALSIGLVAVALLLPREALANRGGRFGSGHDGFGHRGFHHGFGHHGQRGFGHHGGHFRDHGFGRRHHFHGGFRHPHATPRFVVPGWHWNGYGWVWIPGWTWR